VCWILKRLATLAENRSRQQPAPTQLQEPADSGVALETDCDFVGFAGFVVCTGLGQQLRPCRPVRLVFSEPRIGGYLFYGLERSFRTIDLRDR
jgi:hypothetical protein